MFKPHFKKILAAILAATNLAYPLIAVAETYGYRATVRDLMVADSNSSGGNGGSTAPSAVLAVSPSSQSFGSVIVGQTSEPRTVTFTNTGTITAQVGTAYASADYQVTNECNSVVLAPAQSCTVQVRFAPASVKNFAPGSVTLPYSYSGSTGTPTAVANFTAIGAPVPVVYAPALSLDVTNLSFGTVEIGSTLVRHAVLSNTGNLDANLLFSNIPDDMERSGTCSATLAAGQSCDIDITFTPTDTAFKAGLLLVSANGSASYASLSLGGQGVDTYKFEVSAASVTFEPLEAGAKTVTVLNTGSAPLANPVVSTTGPLFNATHNCATLAPGASCEVSLTRFIDTPGYLTSVLYIAFDNAAGLSVPLESTMSGSAFTVLSSSEQSFGDVTVGETSTALTYTILNSGNLDANVLVSTPTHSAVSQGGTCAGTLAVGSQCTVVLQFAPTAHGAISGVVTLQDTLTSRDFVGNALLTYSGQGVGFPVLQATLSGGAVFGPGPLGVPVAKTLTVVNNGTFEASTLALGVTGSNTFSLNSHCPTSLLPGEDCIADVVFTPIAIPVAHASVAVTSSNAPAVNLSLQGSGQAAILTSDTSTYSFGNVNIGSTATKSVTITNVGNIPAVLNISTVSAPFSTSGTCSTNLPANASCVLEITYAPTNTDFRSNMVGVFAAGTNVSVNFSGTGQANPSFSLSTTEVPFGSVNAATDASQSVLVTNTGNVVLTAPYVAVSGLGFNGTHNCGATLPVGATCAVSITFAPNSGVPYTGALYVAFDVVNPQTVSLTGTGLAVALGADSFNQNFGSVSIGATATVNYVVYNTGNVAGPLSITGVSAPFSVSGTCGAILAAGSSCTVALSYSPTDTTIFNRTLMVNVGSKSLTLTYSGTGVAQPLLTVSASSLSLGGVATGATKTASVSVYNAGNVPLSTPAFLSTGEAFSVSHNCPATLPVGASCTAITTFAPTAPQGYSGLLYVGYAGVASQAVALNGTGQAAVLATNVTTHSFGDVAIGSTSSKTIVVTNNGNIAATLNYSALNAPFSRTLNCPATLGAGAVCTVVITYEPTDTSNSSGSLTVSAAGTSATVSFSGTGQANPSFSVSSLTQAFGNLPVGQSGTMSVTVTNFGNVPLNTPEITSTGAVFSAAHNCQATLAVGASCTVTTSFTPTAPQAYSGSLSLGYAGVAPKTVTLSGTGRSAVLNADVSSLAFGNIAIGSSSARTFTVTNTGNLAATLNIGALTAPYSLSTSCGATLAPGANCIGSVTFAPTSATTATNDLTISAANTSVVVSLSGTGQANPSFSLSASSVAFGNVVVGGPNTQTVTVTNTGNVSLSSPSLSVSGTNVSLAHNCPGTLAVGATCTVTLTFAPTGVQTLSGSLSVNFAGLTARTASLTGTGQAVVLSASPATLSFGAVNTGAATSQTVTVSNTGNLAATLMIGTTASPFTRSGTCSTSLAAGASCTVVITYAPTVIGSNSGSISVSSGASAVSISYTGSARANFALQSPAYNLSYEGQHSAWAYTGHAWAWAYSGYVGSAPPGVVNFQTLLVNNSGSTRMVTMYVSADNVWTGATLNNNSLTLPGCTPIGFGGVCSLSFPIPDGTSRLTMSVLNMGTEYNPAGVSAWVVDNTSGSVLADTTIGGAASRWYWF